MSNKHNYEFTIYGKEGCPHCVRAKDFAEDKGLIYTYKQLGVDYTKDNLVDLCFPLVPRTVPQVFVLIDETKVEHIGTCDQFIEYVKTNTTSEG